MKTKAVLAVAVALALSFAMFIPAESDDATISSITLENGNTVSVEKGSEIKLVLVYVSDSPQTCYVSVYDTAKSTPVYSEQQIFKADKEPQRMEIQFPYEKDTSQVHMKITFTNGSTEVYSPIYFDLTFTSSIWSNPALYGAIIVIVILVIAFIVYKSRMAPKKEKNTLTFEQIEAEKQAKKAAASAPKEEKPPTAAKSERQRYLASKKKK